MREYVDVFWVFEWEFSKFWQLNLIKNASEYFLANLTCLEFW